MKKSYLNLKHFIALLALTATVNASAQAPYCASSPFSTGDEEIFNVMLNGQVTNPLYSFTNGCSTPAPGPGSQQSRYSNFKSLGTFANIIQGVVSTFSVAEDECDGSPYYTNGCAIWIDYNQDATFQNSEQVFVENATTISPRSISGSFLVPLGALTGTTVMRVMVAEGYSGSGLTPCLSYGYGETEDYVVNVLPATPCNNTPGANTVVGPSFSICPNTTVNLTGATLYTVGGISYQWASATNSVGPYTPIPTGTASSFVTPSLTANTWYQVTATCANGGTATVYTPTLVAVAPTTTNSVPYYESFEGVGNNGLPNCSWVRTNTVNCKTSTVGTTSNRYARTGNGYADFDYGNTGTTNTYNYYSNGVQLNAGVTYSAYVWYVSPGYSAWSSFTLKYGPNQSTTGSVTLATVSYPSNNAYASLSNTFQVATTGIYYLNISATDNYGYSYFTFDDVGIIAPCSFTNNAVNLTLNAPTAICSGQTASLVAAGAATYSWNTNQTAPTIAVTPTANAMYSVVGSNTLSNCSLTLTAPITVNPVPPVAIFSPTNTICAGASVGMFAVGANSYTWSGSGSNQPLNTVTPNTTTTYSVVGLNSYGCSSNAVQVINVNALPDLSVTGNTMICKGETANLNAFGAASYTWVANSAYLVTANAAVTPTINTTYSLSGTDANGCSITETVAIVVNACLGIETINGTAANVRVYPNPNNGEFTVEATTGGTVKTIEVIDITGRTVMTTNSNNDLVKFNINNLANGVYYVKVKSGNSAEVLKVVKQ